MKLVTFAVDRVAHSLIVSFPVFIKDYSRASLAMFEIESIPIPIPDKNKKANSNSQIRIHNPYIAVGEDYYIQLHMTELIMCKSIRYTFYWEELFVVKHKNKHSCASSIFYDLSPKIITRKCHFDYYFNKTVSPVILEGGNELLLANFHGPRSLQCNSQNGGLPQPATTIHTYTVVPRDFPFDCQLDLEHASGNLSSCPHGNKTKYLTMEFVVNMDFISYYTNRHNKLAEKVKPNLKKCAT